MRVEKLDLIQTAFLKQTEARHTSQPALFSDWLARANTQKSPACHFLFLGPAHVVLQVKTLVVYCYTTNADSHFFGMGACLITKKSWISFFQISHLEQIYGPQAIPPCLPQ